jgi:hypothetical protein
LCVPRCEIIEDDKDNYNVERSYPAGTTPFQNTLYTGMNVLEDQVEANELEIAHVDTRNRYIAAKKATMVDTIESMVNSNFCTIIYHAYKIVIDDLISVMHDAGYDYTHDQIESLYKFYPDLYYRINLKQFNDVDADVYAVFDAANKFYTEEFGPQPDDDSLNAMVNANITANRGTLEYFAMQCINDAYRNIISTVTYAVYCMPFNNISIDVADEIFSTVMDYADEIYVVHGNLIIENMDKIYEILPYVQDSYYRRDITKWDDKLFGINIEQLVNNK